MYLRGLMRGEKYAFYSIAKHLVSKDGFLSNPEKDLLNGFLLEMDLDESQIPEISLDDAVEMLTFSSYAVRKEVFIELVGVTLCDEFLHINEELFLDEVALKYQISNEDKKAMIQMVRDLLNIYKEMQEIIDKPFIN